jgi:hypothetical protein
MKPQTVIPILWSPKGFRKPRYASSYIFSVEADNQRWFKKNVGATFNLSTPRSYTSLRTFDDIIDEANGDYVRGQACGFNIWKIVVEEVKLRLDICRDDWTIMLYCFNPALPSGDNSLTGFGGMVGKENFGCGYARPGVSADSGHKPLLACGATAQDLITRGYSFPMWSATWGAIAGGYAHEKIHCWTELPHASVNQYETITFAYWDYEKIGVLPNEKQVLLESGALT